TLGDGRRALILDAAAEAPPGEEAPRDGVLVAEGLVVGHDDAGDRKRRADVVIDATARRPAPGLVVGHGAGADGELPAQEGGEAAALRVGDAGTGPPCPADGLVVVDRAAADRHARRRADVRRHDADDAVAVAPEGRVAVAAEVGVAAGSL